MAKDKGDTRLLRELSAWAGGALLPGDERKTVLLADDLEVEVHLRVRRRASSDVAQRYRAAALRHLETKPFLVRHCGCFVVAKRSWGGKSHRDCRGKVVAAVVYKPGYRETMQTSHRVVADGELAFMFICGRHRDGHGIDAANVLATVELPPSALAEVRKLDIAAQAKRDEEYRLEHAKLEERYAREAAAKRAAAAPPAGRRVRHLIDVDRNAKPGGGRS